MADITRLSRFVAGLPRDVDLTANSLQVSSLKVGATTPTELTKTMATLLETTTTGTGLPAANLSTEAKQAVLQYKLAAFRVGVTGFTPTVSQTSDTVTTEVQGAAATDTPVGAGDSISAVAAKGIFVGTVADATDVGKVIIRVAGTDNGFDDGTGDEIYGVLSESSGVFTLSYKDSNGDAYEITASDVSAGMDFYFAEIMDLNSFGVDRLLMPAVGGVVDATTASSVYAESTARTAADSALQANLNTEITARTNADNVEYTARTNADTTLQDNIDAEETARLAADSTLQANLNTEITARTDADATLQANIDAEETARSLADTTLQANIDAEETARLAADSTLEANLNTEITARTNADTTLQANIDAEETARSLADTTLQANIDAEETARSLADTTLQANIDAEITSRLDGDSTLQANLNTEITARTDADTTLQNNIDAEETARSLADTTLQANIDAEETARSLADTTLQANLDTETTARIAGDSSIQAVVDDEATTRAAADATLEANLDAEITARTDADATLQNNIDAEETARSLADTTLQNNIDAEETARSLADTTLQANIDAEATARSLADTTLQAQIDALDVSVIDVPYTAATGGIASGDVVALSLTVAGEVIKANATAIATCESVIGVATETKAAGETVLIRAFGEATVTTDGTNFDLGKRVYAHTTAGQASKTAPSTTSNVVYVLGGATDTNKVFVNTNLEYIVA